PLADHLVQPAAGVVVVFVHLQVAGELVDALGQKGDLHLGGAGVSLVLTELLDQCALAFAGQAHPGRPPNDPGSPRAKAIAGGAHPLAGGVVSLSHYITIIPISPSAAARPPRPGRSAPSD